MTYENITLGRFICRPNRFLAQIEIDHRTEACHVKNTSRLRELLLPGAVVSVQKTDNTQRKTPYDLIAVQHENRWVNIDSQAPNRVFAEWTTKSGYLGSISLLRPEVTFGNSRFDFYIEAEQRRIFCEVKGVTLVEDGVACFPGAPTTRGAKHLQQLAECIRQGYEALMVFVVKRDDVTACTPNDDMDPAFGKALRMATEQGLQLLGLGCEAAPDSVAATRTLEVLL